MTTAADIDRTLADLHRGADALGASLLELELDETRKLLDEVALTGATAARWSAESAAVLEAWRGHELLTRQLERAGELRGERGRLRPDHLAELKELVDGSCIELSRSERVSPGDLIARLTQVADDARATVGEAAATWETYTPRLDAARRVLEAAAAPMDGAPDAPPAELASLHDELERLTALLATDPLSVHDADVDALSASLDTEHRERAQIAGLRLETTARLTAAQALMDRVELAQRDGEAAHELALVKISSPSLPAPVAVLSELDAELKQVRGLVDAEAWRDAHAALVQWTGRATAALARATDVADRNRGAIAQRDELRGRLKAFQAKARDLRALEDPSITDLFTRAHESLYGAATDLDDAARRVASYQHALAERGRRTEVSQ